MKVSHGLQLTLKKQQKSCREFLGPRKPQAMTGLICSHTEYKCAVKPSGTWHTHTQTRCYCSLGSLDTIEICTTPPKISVHLPSCVFSSVSSLSNSLMPQPVRDAEHFAVKQSHSRSLTSPLHWWPHRFLERAVEPAVAEHVLDGDGWILQVFERVHQDKVQNYIIEVQVFHLGKTWTLVLLILPWRSLCYCVTVGRGGVSYPSCGQLRLRVFPVVCVLQEVDHLLKRFLKPVWVLKMHTARVKAAVSDRYGSFYWQPGLQSYLACFHDDGGQNLLPRFSQKHSGCSLTQKELSTWMQKWKVTRSAQLADFKLNGAMHW